MAKVATRGGWFSVSFGAYKGQGVTRESVRAAAVDAMSASVRMAPVHRAAAVHTPGYDQYSALVRCRMAYSGVRWPRTTKLA